MKIELLAPAGDTVIGRSAINAGADAVYIGGPAFGARQAAGNSIEEIGELVRYAHGFGARVYLTMNTILFDSELEQARRVAEQAWMVGVDALIVQDLAYLTMDLPPIELHSSTQMFNMSVEKVRRGQDLGFARVVLERAMSLAEIREIGRHTDVELEAFIHGAICVGYSGQCYLSHALCGRGGNRGGCAQSCRSRYDVYDERGEQLSRGRQVLSVGDMMLGERVKDLIEAGVCSLKIEGRLKDEKYVVNNVAYYDDILRGLGVERAASGRCQRNFVPNPQKSFSRPAGVYFLDDRRAKVASVSKSLGELVGRVKSANGRRMVVELVQGVKLNNGDGLCWALDSGEVQGANVNRAEAGMIELNSAQTPRVGDSVYRNFDKSFEPVSVRKIGVQITWAETELTATDSENSVTVPLPKFEEKAKNSQMMQANIERAMSKSGATIFDVESVELQGADELPFVPASVLNSLRSELLEKLYETRLSTYHRRERIKVDLSEVKIDQNVDFRANISNRLSAELYKMVGTSEIEQSPEVTGEIIGREVLRTRFCIRREMNLCPRTKKGIKATPLTLENNGKHLEARFYCDTCEMGLIYKG